MLEIAGGILLAYLVIKFWGLIGPVLLIAFLVVGACAALCGAASVVDAACVRFRAKFPKFRVPRFNVTPGKTPEATKWWGVVLVIVFFAGLVLVLPWLNHN